MGLGFIEHFCLVGMIPIFCFGGGVSVQAVNFLLWI
jgi:hypothetical protein